MPEFKLKRSASDPSNAIILTFAGHWAEAVRTGQFDYVFRKMGPTGFIPTAMYMYVAAPTSAILAVAQIKKYEQMDIASALKLAERGGLVPDELRQYAGDYTSLLVMELEHIKYAQYAVGLAELARDYGYWPSSTFIPLSGMGVEILDRLGRFVDVKRVSRK